MGGLYSFCFFWLVSCFEEGTNFQHKHAFTLNTDFKDIILSNVSNSNLVLILFNWDLLHARLNSHYKVWSYKKKKHKKIKEYRKSLYKEPTVNNCLLILDVKPFRLKVKGKQSISREFQSLAVQGKNSWHRHPCNI